MMMWSDLSTISCFQHRSSQLASHLRMKNAPKHLFNDARCVSFALQLGPVHYEWHPNNASCTINADSTRAQALFANVEEYGQCWRNQIDSICLKVPRCFFCQISTQFVLCWSHVSFCCIFGTVFHPEIAMQMSIENLWAALKERKSFED